MYPTYLKTSKNFSDHDATIATIIGNCGAIAGGAIAGYVSQYMGRRLTIMYVFSPFSFSLSFTKSIFPGSQRLRSLDRSVHSSVDPPFIFQRAFGRRVLHPIRCAGRMGCHSHPACRDESSRFQGYISRGCIPGWERECDHNNGLEGWTLIRNWTDRWFPRPVPKSKPVSDSKI